MNFKAGDELKHKDANGWSYLIIKVIAHEYVLVVTDCPDKDYDITREFKYEFDIVDEQLKKLTKLDKILR